MSWATQRRFRSLHVRLARWLLGCSCQTLVTANFAVRAQVVRIHRLLVRLPGFRLYRHFRPQQHGRPKPGIDVAIAKALLQNCKGGLTRAMSRSDESGRSSYHAAKPQWS
jgi:hypothetical protein